MTIGIYDNLWKVCGRYGAVRGHVGGTKVARVPIDSRGTRTGGFGHGQ